LTDSTLISIRKQGDGSIISPLRASAGVYAWETTGKTFNYMHLDPKLWDEKEKHLNKKYEETWYMRLVLIEVLDLKQPHIKVSISSRSWWKDLRILIILEWSQTILALWKVCRGVLN
jgi:hypothetical protein